MVGYAAFSTTQQAKEQNMGKGDIRTAKGKRYSCSYGNVRPHGTTAAVVKAAPTPKAPVAAAKKTAAKKKA